MSLVVVPPLTDPTLVRPRPEGADLLDLNASFLRRAVTADRLLALAEEDDRAEATPDQALGVLFARASARILELGTRDDARLRALGYGLRSGGDDVLTLALDDLEIRGGTTQRLSDVLAAARRTRLWEEEAAELARAAGLGERVEIVVDTDQQLPAAVALLRGRPEGTVLSGEHANAHRAVLERALDVPVVPGERLRERTVARSGGDGPLWVTRAEHWRSGREWVGWCGGGELDRMPKEALDLCRGLVLTVAEADRDGTVTDSWGRRGSAAPLVSPLPADVPVRADLVVGAPGVSGRAALGTARLLAEGVLGRPVSLAGARPFRLAPYSEWPRVEDLEPRGDLPVWFEFTAPGTLTPRERDAVVAEILASPELTRDLLPGRVAGAVLAPTGAPGEPDGPVRGRDLLWDPSAQVVTVHRAACDDRGPGHFIADLRTGRVRRLPAPLLDVLSACARGETAALDRLPAKAFRRVTEPLLAARILRGTT
ncbi:hypothetical protein ACFV4I_21150 [Nocardiopsis alba]|uniref:hypothetical protein n=1 Tax=Nocardiopsis alba TaxID=53437 RepID=UPI003665E126